MHNIIFHVRDIIQFNNKVKLVVSDVDETIADLFVPAAPEMIKELSDLLIDGKSLFLVSGSGLRSITERVIDLFPNNLRKRIIIAHCSGAEIVGFQDNGETLEIPYYNVSDAALTNAQKITWRNIIQKVISEFKLEIHNPTPLGEFKKQNGDNPLAVMYEDRGPQITLEFINSYNLSGEQISALGNHIPNFNMADLRIPVAKRAEELLEKENIPVTPRLGGMFALDFAIKGVSKTTVIRFALQDYKIINALGLKQEDVNSPAFIEIWGDKFSVLSGTDRHMSEALPKEVRSIDFREENPEEFPEGYNIVIWNGKKHLHEGLLEYLQSRNG